MEGARRRRWSLSVVAGMVAAGALLVIAAVAWAAPDTTITSAPPAFTASPDATFQFSSSESQSTFECKLDAAAAFAACPSPHSVSGLSEGSHTLQVRAIGATSGPDPTPASHTWTVDFTPPDTAFSAGPAPLTSSTDATFEFASEAAATFECSLNGAAFSACSPPRNFTGLSDGTRTFAARAIDQAGNVDPSPATRTWTVDATPPDTTITDGPPSEPSNAAQPFEFTSEAGATFECSLDGAAFSGCTSPHAVSPEGAHTFAVRAVDQAGNVDPTPASRSFVTDTVGPIAPVLSVRPCQTPPRAGAGRGTCVPPGPGRRPGGAATFQTQPGLFVRWSSPGATRYDVRYTPYDPLGIFSTISWKSDVATTSSPFFAPKSGRTYCFVAKARDTPGNQGPASEPVCTTLPYRASSFGGDAISGLTKKKGAGHYRNQYVQGKNTNGFLKLKLYLPTPFGALPASVKRVVLIVTKCPKCGKVHVVLGTLIDTVIDLKASKTLKRRLVTVKTFPSRTGVKASLVVSPTGGKIVKIEGVGVTPF